MQRLEDGRLFVCVRYGSDDGRLEGLLPETLPFRDVSRRAWYFESVAYAYRQGLMSGTGVAVGRQAGHRGIAHDEVAHRAGQLAEQADGMGRVAAHARQNHIVDLVAVSVKRAAEVPHTREGLALHIQLIMQDKLTVRIAGLRGILR